MRRNGVHDFVIIDFYDDYGSRTLIVFIIFIVYTHVMVAFRTPRRAGSQIKLNLIAGQCT